MTPSLFCHNYLWLTWVFRGSATTVPTRLRYPLIDAPAAANSLSAPIAEGLSPARTRAYWAGSMKPWRTRRSRILGNSGMLDSKPLDLIGQKASERV